MNDVVMVTHNPLRVKDLLDGFNTSSDGRTLLDFDIAVPLPPTLPTDGHATLLRKFQSLMTGADGTHHAATIQLRLDCLPTQFWPRLHARLGAIVAPHKDHSGSCVWLSGAIFTIPLQPHPRFALLRQLPSQDFWIEVWCTTPHYSTPPQRLH